MTRRSLPNLVFGYKTQDGNGDRAAFSKWLPGERVGYPNYLVNPRSKIIGALRANVPVSPVCKTVKLVGGPFAAEILPSLDRSEHRLRRWLIALHPPSEGKRAYDLQT